MSVPRREQKCSQCDFSSETSKGLNIHIKKVHERLVESALVWLPEALLTPGQKEQLSSLEKSYITAPTAHSIPQRPKNCPISSRRPSTKCGHLHGYLSSSLTAPTANGLRTDGKSSQEGSSVPTAGKSKDSRAQASATVAVSSNLPRTESAPPITVLGNHMDDEISFEPEMETFEEYSESRRGENRPSTEPGPSKRPHQGEMFEQQAEPKSESPEDLSADKNYFEDADMDLEWPPRIFPNDVHRLVFRKSVTRSRRCDRQPHCELQETARSFEAEVFTRTINTSQRNLLKNLWPTTVSETITDQRLELLRQGKDPSKCATFLAILGECVILDYRSSCQYDLVLRCSMCGEPICGIKKMEIHIKEHLQREYHPCGVCEIPDETSNDVTGQISFCDFNSRGVVGPTRVEGPASRAPNPSGSISEPPNPTPSAKEAGAAPPSLKPAQSSK